MHPFHMMLAGYAVLALIGFAFVLRWERRHFSAKGLGGSWLRVRLASIPALLATAALVVLLIPAIVLAAVYAGGIGAGWVWVGMNAAYLLVWVAYVHGKLEPGLHWSWMRSNVVTILLPTLAVGWLLSLMRDGPQSRLQELGHAAAVGTVCMLVAAAASPSLRPTVCRAIRSRWA